MGVSKTVSWKFIQFLLYLQCELVSLGNVNFYVLMDFLHWNHFEWGMWMKSSNHLWWYVPGGLSHHSWQESKAQLTFLARWQSASRANQTREGTKIWWHGTVESVENTWPLQACKTFVCLGFCRPGLSEAYPLSAAGDTRASECISVIPLFWQFSNCNMLHTNWLQLALDHLLKGVNCCLKVTR